MNTVHISTIHAFCSRILREFPFQANVPANFSILQGIDQKLLLQETLKNTLKDIATNLEDRHRAALTRLLRRYGGQQKLVDFFSMMINQRDVIAQLRQQLYNDQNDTEIHEALQQRVLEQLMPTINIPEFIRCLNAVMQVAAGKNVKTVRDLTQQLETLHAKSPNSPEVSKFLKQIVELITIKNGAIAKAAFIGQRLMQQTLKPKSIFWYRLRKRVKSCQSQKKKKMTIKQAMLKPMTIYCSVQSRPAHAVHPNPQRL